MKPMKSLFVAAGLAAGSMLAGQSASAEMLDPADPNDALEISKRLQCGVSADEPAVYHWSGNIYGRSPGQRDKLLFKGEGMNIRRCVEVTDPERGTGWRLLCFCELRGAHGSSDAELAEGRLGRGLLPLCP